MPKTVKYPAIINELNQGGNTCLLLEDPPQQDRSVVEDPRSHHVVCISGKTLHSMRQNQDRLLEFLSKKPQIRLADLAYTLSARRIHHVFRRAYSTGTIRDLTENIGADLSSVSVETSYETEETPSVAFAFSGQGSQYSSVGKQLFKTNVIFRKSIEELNAMATSNGFEPFLKMFTSSDSDKKKIPPSPLQTQLGLVSLHIALAKMWRSWGVIPKVVVGHSLGEYSALCVAGVLSIHDTIYLVGKRAMLMQNRCTMKTHAMLAIQASHETVERFFEMGGLQTCEISCVNSSTSTVVSGAIDDIQTLQNRLLLEGLKSLVLDVPYAFHSCQMDSILDEFKVILEGVMINKPLIPFLSSLESISSTKEGTLLPDYLLRQTRHRVNFAGALTAGRSAGLINDHTIWIENGPASVCVEFVRTTLRVDSRRLISTLKSNECCWETLSKGMSRIYNAGLNPSWTGFHQEYSEALNLLELPTYAFDLKNYWIPYRGEWALMKKPNQVVEPCFSTTFLQRVEKEVRHENCHFVDFSSNLFEPKLLAAVEGHLVNGVALCPSSVFATMAFTATSYLAAQVGQSNSTPEIDITRMDISVPLIIQPNTKDQIIKVSCSKSLDAGSTDVSFSSRKGDDTYTHGHCTVCFGSASGWRDEWARHAYLVTSRVNSLLESVDTGAAVRIPGQVVYKLFSSLVHYSTDYRGLKEVVLNSALKEATATIRLQDMGNDENSQHSPYWIDTIIHLAGFVLNGNLMAPEGLAYISNGWDSLRVAGALSKDRLYTGYVRMQPSNGRGLFAGDVYLFDGEAVTAVCTRLKFQEMKKNSLQTLLSTGASSAQPEPTFGLKVKDSAQTRAGVSAVPRTDATFALSNSIGQSPAQTISPLQFSKVLEVIADEVAINVSDLEDHVSFEELGLDSLLSISITARFRALAGLELPNGVFTLYPTVARLRDYFCLHFPGTNLVNGYKNGYENGHESGRKNDHNAINSSVTLETWGGQKAPASSTGQPNDSRILSSTNSTAAEAGLIEKKLAAVSAGTGPDSLVNGSMHPSVVKHGADSKPVRNGDHSPITHAIRGFEREPESSPSPSPFRPTVFSSPNFSCATLLQGHHKPGTPALFLIAPGSGYTGSYANITRFENQIAVYSLQSPLLNDPTQFNCPFEEMASMYLREIRAVQPLGPYLLGGWSIGGMYAYESARQLIDRGEQVSGLILIDSPCPAPMSFLPEPEALINILTMMGMFAPIQRKGKPDEPMPLNMQQHLTRSFCALRAYEPVPMKTGHRPCHVFAIWAERGDFGKVGEKIKEAMDLLLDSKQPLDEKDRVLDKDWMSTPRSSLGPNGWDRLTCGEVECYSVDGDHESIMIPPQVCLRMHRSSYPLLTL